MASDFWETGFPDEADYRALLDEVGVDLLQRLLGSQGVFLSAAKEAYPSWMNRFIFGEDWYIKAFEFVSTDDHHTSLTGMRVPELALDTLEQAFIARQEQTLTTTHSPRIVQVERLPDGSVRATIEYQRLRSKRAKKLQYEEHTIDLICRTLPTKEIEILSFPKSPTDPMIIRDVSGVILNDLKVEAEVLDIENGLPQDARVDVFDRLIAQRDQSGWRVQDVVELTVTRERRHSGGSDDDSDTRVLKGEKVEILRTAVLQGSNLREHKLVKDLVDQGYFFSAIDFWAFNPTVRGATEDVRVQIDFKRKPRSLVVKATKVRAAKSEKEGDDEISSAVPSDLSREVVNFFWNEIYRHFYAVKQAALKVAKRITPSPDTSKDNEPRIG